MGLYPEVTYNGSAYQFGRPVDIPSLKINGGDFVYSGVNGPQDHGLISWSMDPAVSTGTVSTGAGTIYLVRLPIRTPSIISKIWWVHTAGPTTPTPGQNWVGIYTISGTTGTLAASVGVDGKTTNGPQSADLSPTLSIDSAQYIYVAYTFTASVQPTLMRGGGQSAAGNVVNQSAPATYRFATAGTGTTLPSSLNLASNSQTGVSALWSAVS